MLTHPIYKKLAFMKRSKTDQRIIQCDYESEETLFLS